MHDALKQFNDNLSVAKNQSVLFNYLENTLFIPYSFDDLLRAQIVYAVSAFDKFIHDLIRIGMVDIFCKKRLSTPKYLAYTLSLDTYSQLASATIPPKEYLFGNDVIKKHKQFSFQDPTKIADGLSLIWNECHKWQKISLVVGLPEETLKTQLMTIVDRRNKIVHEADIDPFSGSRYSISKEEANIAIDFLNKVAHAIYDNVK